MDATFWATAALVAFIGLLIYLKVPAIITKSLDDRADKIRKDLDDARSMREEAQALLAEYKRKQNQAENEAQAIIDAAKRDADKLYAEANDKLEDYIVRRTKLAEQKIKQAEMQAINDIKTLAIERAARASEIVLYRKLLNNADSFIDTSINEVKNRTW